MKRPQKDNLTGIFAILLSLALPLIIVSCTYEETFRCDRCGETFPEKYKVHDFDLNYVCPSCIDEQMLDIGFEKAGFCKECNEYYEAIYLNSYGICENCSDKYLCECWICGELGLCWSGDSGYFLCNQCTEDVLCDPDIGEALENAYK